MSEPTCERCGPQELPTTLLDVGTTDKPCMICLRCALERERIEPTARKGGKPPAPIRAGGRTWVPR